MLLRRIRRDFVVMKRCLSAVTPSVFAHHSEAPHSTVDQFEVDKYTAHCSDFWSLSGPFKALHTLNELRVPFIKDALNTERNQLAEDKVWQSKARPLESMKILDVGCGAGLLSEPLARLGAELTGLDANSDNIKIAEHHYLHDPELLGRIHYMCGRVEDEAEIRPNFYDGVVASEILEHVADQSTFVASCCQLVKPGGSLFFTTLNKTWLSQLLAVFLAERILCLVPTGMHDWNKFVSPDDLQAMLSQNFMDTRLIHGMTLNPLTLKWRWINDTRVNYIVHAIKSQSYKSTDLSSNSSCSSDED